MTNESVKESVEFVAVNATGVAISLGSLEYNLRMFILLCTAIYALIKVIKGIRELRNKK